MKKTSMLIIIAVISFLTVASIVAVFYLMANDTNSEGNAVWIQEIINGTKKYEKWDQRERTISGCTYKNNPVYYITYSGDDLYNDLFDKNGNKICSPSGGFSGNGDGRCKDFSEDDNCQLIWEKVQ